MPSQVKSALRKFSEGKDHDCDSFMSDVSVLYKSCVAHLANGPLCLLNLNGLTRLLRLQTINWENDEPCLQYLLYRNVSIDEAEVNRLTFDQYQNLFEFVQKVHQPNAIHCKMMENERWAEYFATCNNIKRFKHC